MTTSITGLSTLVGLSTGQVVGLLLIIVVAELLLKGLALWHAARNKHTGWFIVILAINSIGIIPLIYMIIHVWNKKK
jgi:hypothetical protein